MGFKFNKEKQQAHIEAQKEKEEEQKKLTVIDIPQEEDSSPYVVNKKFEKQYDVYVGRPSPYGNPYRAGIDGTRDEVIAMFEQYLLSDPVLMEKVKNELKGKVLACSCAPLRCHADILLRYANPELFPEYTIDRKPKI